MMARVSEGFKGLSTDKLGKKGADGGGIETTVIEKLNDLRRIGCSKVVGLEIAFSGKSCAVTAAELTTPKL